jgi:hypothetical protein
LTSTIIAYARAAKDESRIEAALEKAGISYSIRLDAVPDASEGTACSLAQVYVVGESNAARARATLEGAGLEDFVLGRR